MLTRNGARQLMIVLEDEDLLIRAGISSYPKAYLIERANHLRGVLTEFLQRFENEHNNDQCQGVLAIRKMRTAAGDFVNQLETSPHLTSTHIVISLRDRFFAAEEDIREILNRPTAN